VSGTNGGVENGSGDALSIVVLGLSITSSWGNGHATNYRGLVRALAGRGHDVLFLERDVPWYAGNRDLPEPPWGRTELYGSLDELRDRFAADVRAADLVVVGSYVPDGVEVGAWVQETVAAGRRRGGGGVSAFYDIDTPITLAKLARGDHEYLSPELVRGYDLYLSFTGGPVLERIERRWGAWRALPFHCFYDPEVHRPVECEPRWDLGYMGTYSDDRQPKVDELLVRPARQAVARRFAVAGPGYPEGVSWPPNVERVEHLPPGEHAGFYAGQRFTLNVTREHMVAAGWSPSVRLFEAAGCGTPVISDRWAGLDDYFRPGEEIYLADDAGDVLRILDQTTEEERRRVARRARRRVEAEHTAERRAEQLEGYLRQARRGAARTAADGRRPSGAPAPEVRRRPVAAPAATAEHETGSGASRSEPAVGTAAAAAADSEAADGTKRGSATP
jgi:spore maturation protein CgeB